VEIVGSNPTRVANLREFEVLGYRPGTGDPANSVGS
jgi:hypothetical protein